MDGGISNAGAKRRRLDDRGGGGAGAAGGAGGVGGDASHLALLDSLPGMAFTYRIKPDGTSSFTYVSA